MCFYGRWLLQRNQEKVDIYRSFPHPPCVLQKLGAESFVIKHFVNKCHDTFKFTLSDFAEQCPPSRGVIWHGECVHEFLNTHVIVAADKDGDQVVMYLKRYLMEQNNNMGVFHKTETRYTASLGTSQPIKN